MSARPSEAERSRLEALQRYAVLDTPAEQAFDDIARLASLICGTPVAQINFIDATRQWSKASVGAPRGELSRRSGLCIRAILQRDPLVVPDVAADESFAARAPAVGDPAVRFYAGAPIVTADGHALGTVCVFDHQPRSLTAEQTGALAAMARLVMSELELRRLRSARRDDVGDDAARERGESFRRLASAANEGITIIIDDRIVEANNAFGQLFGYEVAEVVGRTPLDFVAPESRDAATQHVTVSSERPYEARGKRKNGTTFDIEVIMKSIPYKGRTALGCVVRDITERKEIDRLKNEFVSIVSHELRTPLTSIRGSLGLMEGGAVGELPPKAHDLVRIARQNADRLIRLINDILDLEKIESGKVQLRITSLDPVELVDSTIAELGAMALQYKVTLTSLVTRRDPITGDRDRVIQVLTNLLSNAVKFSPEGGVVTVAATDGPPGFLRVAITDEGPGITEEQKAQLFVRFQQLEQANTRRRGGTGLGLAISRSLVEQQGGRIGVDSAPGRGSTFWFELPLVPAARTGEEPSAPNADVERPAVLVVEDDPAVARVLGIMLGRHGHEVVMAGTLDQARRILARSRPSAILLDMGLPDGSGLDLLDHLIGTAGLELVPVIVLSGEGPQADHRNSRVSEWLTKPFTERELLRAISGAIGEPEPERWHTRP
ncbi:MAG TPA: ATP-binding protein [Gemmatimonadaceae bacterium]|nr:ATP-binding protein [Gemmatimonadaceae bacterium]